MHTPYLHKSFTFFSFSNLKKKLSYVTIFMKVRVVQKCIYHQNFIQHYLQDIKWKIIPIFKR